MTITQLVTDTRPELILEGAEMEEFVASIQPLFKPEGSTAVAAPNRIRVTRRSDGGHTFFYE